MTARRLLPACLGAALLSGALVGVLAPTAQAQTASPSPTASPVRDCARGAALRPGQVTITAQQAIDVTAFATSGDRIDLVAADRRAGTRTIRTATVDGTSQVSFRIRPVVNTRLSADRTPEPCSDPVFGSPFSTVSVRTALSLGAVRSGPRNYAFSGRAFPVRNGQAVRLYRRTPQGTEVLTATTTVTSAGTWRIDRRFTGSGRFHFVARTPADALNAAGMSNVRPTLVY